MTATYVLTEDVGKVRLHINDTDVTAPKLTDEEITYALTLGGSVNGAVIQCLLWLLVKLSDPNFTADWLTVDNASAFKSMNSLLSLKRAEFGIAAITTTSAHTYRADSAATEAPDFTDGRP
jgi:hypothetical protein